MADRIEAEQRGEGEGDQPKTSPSGPSEIPQPLRILQEISGSLVAPSAGNGQSLTPLRISGSQPPLFCVHGLGGHVACFLPLANGLTQERPVYGLQGQGLEPGQTPHERMEDMAAFYLNEIREIQPRGPYWLAGWSLGGLIALDTANQLLASGESVAMLAMFDTYLSLDEFEQLDVSDQAVIGFIAPLLNIAPKELKKLSLDQQWQRIAERANLAEGIGVAEIRRLAEVCKAHLKAAAIYQPRPYTGQAVLFQAEEDRGRLDKRWKTLCPALQVERVPGDHYSMLRKPHVETLAAILDRYLAGGGPRQDGKR
jgi:thioesterase domain-containing protein